MVSWPVFQLMRISHVDSLRIEHQLDRSRDDALLFGTFDRKRTDQRRFEVGGRDFQHTVVQVEQKVIEDGQRVLIAYDFARSLEYVQQRG